MRIVFVIRRKGDVGRYGEESAENSPIAVGHQRPATGDQTSKVMKWERSGDTKHDEKTIGVRHVHKTYEDRSVRVDLQRLRRRVREGKCGWWDHTVGQKRGLGKFATGIVRGLAT